MTQATTTVDKCLGRFTVRCANAGIAYKVLEDVGDPYEQITTEAQRYDLIVVGQETHFRFETQNAADDTINKLLKFSPRPVIIAPSGAAPTENHGVFFCCDGSPKASRALKSFVDLGILRDWPVTVLAVDQNRLVAAKNADRAMDYLSLHGIKASICRSNRSCFPARSFFSRQKCYRQV